MLKCTKCNWSGINLVALEGREFACCPDCHNPFDGILASDAIVSDTAVDESKKEKNTREQIEAFFSGSTND